MAELTPSERLQPCLLDRLTDENPTEQAEGRDQRVFSLQQLKRAVLRDISWLLNTANKDRTGEFEEFPEVASSVLNFGSPDLTGLTSTAMPKRELERLVRRALQIYEPRVMSNTVKVQVMETRDYRDKRSIELEIRGDMWAQPLPDPLFLKTEVDLGTGRCETREDRGG